MCGPGVHGSPRATGDEERLQGEGEDLRFGDSVSGLRVQSVPFRSSLGCVPTMGRCDIPPPVELVES